MTENLIKTSEKAVTTEIIRGSGANSTKVIQLNSSGEVSPEYLVSDIDQWRLDQNIAVTTSDTVISTGWERVDTATQGKIGTGMTQSSGVFTFPRTGMWLVSFIGTLNRNSSDVTNIMGSLVATSGSGGTTDNMVAKGFTNVSSSGTYSQMFAQSVVNVSATADVKVKAEIVATGTGADLLGTSLINYTSLTFTYIGS